MVTAARVEALKTSNFMPDFFFFLFLRLLLEETSVATTVGAALTVETREDRAPCGSATTTVATADATREGRETPKTQLM